jgi:hypothetical protein
MRLEGQLDNDREFVGGGRRIVYVGRLGLVNWFKGIQAYVADRVSSFGLPRTEADITGFVSRIHRCTDMTILGEILVESRAGTVAARTVVSVRDQTAVFRQDGKKVRRAAFQVLRTGQQVQVWFPPLIFAPLLGQGTAQEILVVE